MYNYLGGRIVAITKVSDTHHTARLRPYDLNVVKGNVYQLNPKSFFDFPYYAAGDAELYNEIRRGQQIKMAVIEYLDFDSLVTWKNDSLVMPYTLNFEGVIIKNVHLPDTLSPPLFTDTSAHRPWLVFEQPVTFSYTTIQADWQCSRCMLKKPFRIVNCILGQHWEPVFAFWHSIFLSNVEIVNDVASRLFTEENLSSDSMAIKMLELYYKSDNKWFTENEETVPLYLFADSCVFYGEAAIVNTDRSTEMDFTGCTFHDNVYLTRDIPQHPGVLYFGQNKSVAGAAYTNRFPMQNINLFGSTIRGSFHGEYETFKNITLTNTLFIDSLFLYNSDFSDSITESTGFFQSQFVSSPKLLLDPLHFNMRSLNINSVAIKKFEFPYSLRDTTLKRNSEPYLENVQSFYERLITNLKQTYVQNADLGSDLENKLEHKWLEYEMAYLKCNGGVTGKLRYFLLYLLELTVGNGYQGGDNFFYTSVTIILLFAFAYYFFYGITIINFTNKSNDPVSPNEYNRHEQIKNWIKCFWQSFQIFINPKFSLSYFNFSGGLFALVVAEWIIGIVMIILFLVYIATTYSFVRVLIGL